MARLTKDQWEDLIADYHTGQFSKNALAEKYEVSHTAVNKKLKNIDPKHRDKVSTLVSIKTDLMQESFKEVQAVETIVDERTKHLAFFQESALSNQKKANVLLESAEKLSEFRDHATITKTNKETVLGKEPETVINNANIQTNTNLEWELM